MTQPQSRTSGPAFPGPGSPTAASPARIWPPLVAYPALRVRSADSRAPRRNRDPVRKY